MNNLFLIAAIALTTNSLAQPTKEMLANFNTSRQQWEKVRNTHQNTYMYTLDITGGEGDFHQELDVFIENGKVAKTTYRFYKGQKITQTDNKLRKEFGDYKVVTIDEMFVHCEKEVFTKDSVQNYVYFFMDSNKLPTTFAYYPKNMADAPLYGYSIRKIEMSNQTSKDTDIIGSWSLVYGYDTKTKKRKKYATSAGAAFDATFDKEGNFGYRMDVNSCGDNYTLLPNNTIKIGTPTQGAICTQACCDKVSPPFLAVSKYAFRKGQLVLIDGTMEYVFDRVK